MNLRNYLLAGGMMVGSIFNQGCFESQASDLNPQIEKREVRVGTNIHFCNSWFDENLDGRVDLNELRGVKNSFENNEWIRILTQIEGMRGSEAYVELRKRGQSGVLDSRREEIHSNRRVIAMEYKPWKLYQVSGRGEYLVGLFINEKLNEVGVFEVR